MIHRSTGAFALTLSILLSTSAAALPAFAASGDTVPTGIITIEQTPVYGITWKWTLLNTDHASFTGNKETEQVNIPAGSYTLFFDSPKGYTTAVQLLQGDTVLQKAESPQLTFTYDGSASLRIKVAYTLFYKGQVNVVSTPKGIPFEMRGPNLIVLPGVTPQSFPDMPIGQYSVRYFPEGCTATPPRSDELKYESRVDFSVTLSCDGVKAMEEKRSESTKFVNTSVGEDVIVLRDVPTDAWFATYVNSVVRRGIMAGYKNDDGSPSDRFGPTEPVTLAQLAKIAHEISGLDESRTTSFPVNMSAYGWMQTYIASAEANDWLVFTDSGADVNRPATRGEVLVTLLQALDIPLKWPRGNMFSDVYRRTPYAGAIETAAAAGVVAGTLDNTGKLTGAFGPVNSVNRAEMAKIVMMAIEKYKLSVSEVEE
ncbi:MAG: S-layer homology domain-containing protein [Candidatus Peribacteraceae bacterium]|jgi:hypothetical protein